MSDQWNHVRIVGSMRVPEGVTDDDVADAVVAIAESKRWGFTGICKVMTEAELAGEDTPDPSILSGGVQLTPDDFKRAFLAWAFSPECEEYEVNGIDGGTINVDKAWAYILTRLTGGGAS